MAREGLQLPGSQTVWGLPLKEAAGLGQGDPEWQLPFSTLEPLKGPPSPRVAVPSGPFSFPSRGHVVGHSDFRMHPGQGTWEGFHLPIK